MGRDLSVEIYDGRDEALKNATAHPTTAFVSKLPPDIDDTKLNEIFSRFGKVFAARVIRDKKSGIQKV